MLPHSVNSTENASPFQSSQSWKCDPIQQHIPISLLLGCSPTPLSPSTPGGKGSGWSKIIKTKKQRPHASKIWDNIRTIFSLNRYILHFWLWLRLWLHQNLRWNQNVVFPRSLSRGWGWGYSLEFWVVICHLVLQVLTLFQTRKCHFSHWFFRPQQCKTPTLRGGTSMNFIRLLQVVITPSVISESTSH